MKKNYTLLLSLLIILAGCGSKDKGKIKAKKQHKSEKIAKHIDAQEAQVDTVDIPLASEEIKSYFDDEDVNLGEFVLIDDTETESKIVENNVNTDAKIEENNTQIAANNEINLTEDDFDDFSWVQEIEQENDRFEKCHFEFDKYDLQNNQEKKVENNVKLAKKILDEGGDPTIVIEGHSCHSAGSMTYNMVLSEKRAKAVADRFVNAGIPRNNIKIVARGQEVPEKDENGNNITGDRHQQWANRRSEIRVVYS